MGGRAGHLQHRKGQPNFIAWGQKKSPSVKRLRIYLLRKLQSDGRSSDSRIALLTAPSHPEFSESLNHGQWLIAAFVPEYSGGSVPDSDRFPYWALCERHRIVTN